MAKKSFTLLGFIILAMYTFAMPFYTRKEIKLHVEKKMEHRSATISNPLQAFIVNFQLEINVDAPIKDLTVLITDTTTGETTHHQVNDHSRVFIVDLSNLDPNGQYMIAFYASNNLISTGEFTLN